MQFSVTSCNFRAHLSKCSSHLPLVEKGLNLCSSLSVRHTNTKLHLGLLFFIVMFTCLCSILRSCDRAAS
jgi:hypothetical protein